MSSDRDRKEYDFEDFMYLFELTLSYDEKDEKEIPFFTQLSSKWEF